MVNLRLDNDPHFLLYYVYNGERYDKTIKITRTSRLGLCLYSTVSNPSYYYRTGDIMYVLTINGIVYLYDNEKDARKAFHQSVAKNGINNVNIERKDFVSVYG